jgi:hypothetical protein
MYVTDKQFRHRGTSTWPEKPAKAATERIKVVRMQHGGNGNPEPLAIERLSRLMQAETATALEELSPVAAKDIAGSGAAVAFLTGMGTVDLPAEDKAAMKAFVDAGGILVIDAAGGSVEIGRDFARSMTDVVDELFPGELKPLPADCAVYDQKGRVVGKVDYRRETARKLGGKAGPNLRGVTDTAGRVKVVFSAEDLTAAVAGANTYGLDGYTPDSAYALLRNIVLQALSATTSARK